MKHKYTLICAIMFVVALVSLIADVSSTGNQVRTDGPVMALTAPQKLTVVTNTDTVLVNIAKGDSVRILGFSRLTYSQSVLVETSRGDRGKLDASQLPIRQLIIDGENKGDTIVRLTPEYLSGRLHEYTAKTSAGVEVKLQGNDFVPILPGWEDYNLDNNASTSVATQKSLEKCKGETLERIENKYGMAYNILVGADGGRKAKFRIYAYGPDGKIYMPTIAFDQQGEATDFSFDLLTGKASNSWLLGNPVAGMVISTPLTRLLTRSDVYTTPSKTGESTPWYIYILFVLAVIALLSWYVLTPSLIVLLMGWVVEYPVVFKPLGNMALRCLIVTVSIVSAIFWMIALMAWGMSWFLTLLVIPVSYYCCRLATEYLEPYVPHQRCPRCKRIETIEFDYDEVTGTKYMKGADIKRDKLLSTHDERYQTWTQVTTTYTDGSKTSHRENVRNHKRRHDTYRYIDFEVTYFVTFYLNHFICRHCQYHETSTSTTQEEVDRKVVGSHSGTESYEV